MDPKTLQACKATNRYWRDRLNSIEFLQTTHFKWKGKGQFMYLHFSQGPFHLKRDWIVKMDITTGQTVEFTLPMTVLPGGWFRIIGIANGNVCMRYSSTGNQAQLIIWNPVTQAFRNIRDPTQHFCTMCTFTYAFLYYPESTQYAIVHIFKHNLRDEQSWLTMFSAESSDWQYVIPCPSYVRKLHEKNVFLDGISFWLGWSVHDAASPSYILAFSVVTKSFFSIPIPHYAQSHDHQLMVYEDYLYLVCNRDTADGFEITMWKIYKKSGEYTWEKILTLTGVGTIEIPLLFDGKQLILLKKTHRERNVFFGSPEIS